MKKLISLCAILAFMLLIFHLDATKAASPRVVSVPFTADLTAAALSSTMKPEATAEFLGVTLHASEAITETFTVTLDSIHGANYDTLLKSQSLSASQNYFWSPDIPIQLSKGDGLTFACTNGNTTGSVYVVAWYKLGG